jgi:hypothetical protein
MHISGYVKNKASLKYNMSVAGLCLVIFFSILYDYTHRAYLLVNKVEAQNSEAMN